MALIGLERLDRSEMTPRLTNILFSRPSHNSETLCPTISNKTLQGMSTDVVRRDPRFHDSRWVRH